VGLILYGILMMKTMNKKINIAIFVSGNGTNCENIIRYFKNSEKANVALVVSNREDAYALTRAEKLGVPTSVMPKSKFNDKTLLMSLMREYDIEFVVLAGFLLMVPKFLIEAYPHRIVNIHPALLPKYGGKGMYGMHVHESVRANNETESGITIHYVSEQCDAGEIIFQAKTPVELSDTPEDIAAHIHVLEQKYFPQIIDKVL
jgi:phosphoribosylglycinamide formyltransferase-1